MMKNTQLPRCYSSEITALCHAVSEKVMSVESTAKSVSVEVAEIAAMRPALVRAKYEQLFGTAPGELGTSFLRARIAYAVQEARTGLHLTASEIAALEHIATFEPLINPDKRPLAKAKTYRAGKTWTRVYRGVRHAIRADGRGRFVYEGDGLTYASPTAVARHITGTHISGKAFFGITD